MPRRAFDGETRKVALNMKTTADVRSRLEDAAISSGRSLTHEVEHRLQSSLDNEALLRSTFGGGIQAEMFQRLADVVKRARQLCADKEFDEIKTRSVVSAACIRVVTMYCWTGGRLPQEQHKRVHGKPVPLSEWKPEHLGVDLADTIMIVEGDQAVEDLDVQIANRWSGDGRVSEMKAKLSKHGNPPGTKPLKDIMGR